MFEFQHFLVQYLYQHNFSIYLVQFLYQKNKKMTFITMHLQIKTVKFQQQGHLKQPTQSTELNELRKIIYFSKSEVSVERLLVCNAIEKLSEHGNSVGHMIMPAICIIPWTQSLENILMYAYHDPTFTRKRCRIS